MDSTINAWELHPTQTLRSVRALADERGVVSAERRTMEATMFDELIGGIRDLVSAKRVYGDWYEKDGLTVIPAATVYGGGGGGAGRRDDEESGSGGGVGVIARPAGAWIVDDGKVRWKPAVDPNRIFLGVQIIALTAILVRGRVLRAQLKHERHSKPTLCHRAALGRRR